MRTCVKLEPPRKRGRKKNRRPQDWETQPLRTDRRLHPPIWVEHFIGQATCEGFSRARSRSFLRLYAPGTHLWTIAGDL